MSDLVAMVEKLERRPCIDSGIRGTFQTVSPKAMMENPQTAMKPRTVKVLMFTLTEALASSLFNWSQVLLAVGAAAVLIGTIGAFAMGFAKEQFANERISANETETARAKEAAAVATQKAETERLERLKLEVKLAPRSLAGPDATAFTKAASASVHGVPVDVISYEGMGADVAALSQQIAAALHAAGSPAAHVLTPMGAGAVVHGILVRAAADAPANQKAAIGSIVVAFQLAGLAAGPWAEYPANEPPAGGYMGPQGAPLAKLRILVGGKPP